MTWRDTLHHAIVIGLVMFGLAACGNNDGRAATAGPTLTTVPPSIPSVAATANIGTSSETPSPLTSISATMPPAPTEMTETMPMGSPAISAVTITPAATGTPCPTVLATVQATGTMTQTATVTAQPSGTSTAGITSTNTPTPATAVVPDPCNVTTSTRMDGETLDTAVPASTDPAATSVTPNQTVTATP